ncbi:hypothetical protein HNS38_17810 [Lentimicrobium sp. L6]|uniref:hypothetical protein n=1 Tax=Lentimicrobium sp. L6 TaxID=2735916 RepID=UPI00155266B1|nr:hypothetical protein [Lentimicrobium sp. L6]NPD86629.1 hypothetical protein [Lentimicrobium sp. L6]
MSPSDFVWKCRLLRLLLGLLGFVLLRMEGMKNALNIIVGRVSQVEVFEPFRLYLEMHIAAFIVRSSRLCFALEGKHEEYPHIVGRVPQVEVYEPFRLYQGRIESRLKACNIKARSKAPCFEHKIKHQPEGLRENN